MQITLVSMGHERNSQGILRMKDKYLSSVPKSHFYFVTGGQMCLAFPIGITLLVLPTLIWP